MPKLKIGDLTANIPIIQGGMGVGVSGVSLASAVANEGGIGVLSAAGLGFDLPGYKSDPIRVSCQALRLEIQKAREATTGIIGINIMVALSNYSELVKTAIEEKVDIIFAGAGLPIDLPQYLTAGSHTKLIPIVSSDRAAELILKKWVSKYEYLPDAFVVEGPLAGGHLGFKRNQIDDEAYTLGNLVPQVLEKIRHYEVLYRRKIPIIAAGGIYTGEDIYRFLRLGSDGVQMGTRFVTTYECDASEAFKNSYLSCSKEDITIINSPVGLPGRAIRNSFLEAVENGSNYPTKCPYHCIKTCDVNKSPYCIALALLNAKKGIMKNGFAFAGENAFRAEEIVSIHDLIASLESEYSACTHITLTS